MVVFAVVVCAVVVRWCAQRVSEFVLRAVRCGAVWYVGVR